MDERREGCSLGGGEGEAMFASLSEERLEVEVECIGDVVGDFLHSGFGHG